MMTANSSKSNSYLIFLLFKGTLLPATIIHASLAEILAKPMSQESEHDNCIGPMTTMARDQWASVRDQLLQAAPTNEVEFVTTIIQHVNSIKDRT